MVNLHSVLGRCRCPLHSGELVSLGSHLLANPDCVLVCSRLDSIRDHVSRAPRRMDKLQVCFDNRTKAFGFPSPRTFVRFFLTLLVLLRLYFNSLVVCLRLSVHSTL